MLRFVRRAYSTTVIAPPHALVFLEHRKGVLDSASLSALTAAHQLGGNVTGLVIGSEEHVQDVVGKAKKYPCLSIILFCRT